MGLFLTISLSLQIYATLPLILTGFLSAILYFLISRYASIGFTKIYFCILPGLLVTMFSVLAVGKVGSDKYYLFSTVILPLVLFKKKKHYLPLVLANVALYFVIECLQEVVKPVATLPKSQLLVYTTVNSMTIFIFIYALIHLFKNEIFGFQRQIEDQKAIIDEKNQEVRESIEYAKRIQHAILPSEDFRKQYLPDSFVLYKPKDIVAGDFYWMDKANGKIYFAAADCTGHGVPGAMVSVVCHNALNRALHEDKLIHPAKILDRTREIVIETLKSEANSVKDGMDIGLCSYDVASKKLEFAGANNGLYLIRNGVLSEIKPDKEPIGLFENSSPFTNHEMIMNQGDLVYLFTDGFADQFGGPKGKKYKYKPFKAFIQKLDETPIEGQAELLSNEFEKWRGSIEQIDDVCIIGVRF